LTYRGWKAAPTKNFLLFRNLKVKHLGFGRQIYQMGSSIQNHIGEKLCLVNLTGIGTGDSNSDWNLVFNQVGQIIIRTITGFCFDFKIPLGIRPINAIVNKKQIRLMTF